MLFIKKYLIPIVFVLLLFVIVSFSAFQVKNDYSKSKTNLENYWSNKISSEEFSELIKPYVLSNKDGHTIFNEIINKSHDNNIMNHFELLLPVFICLICIYPIYISFNSGFMNNILLRKKYSSEIKNIEFKVIIVNSIFPLAIFLLLILSYTITGNFDFEKTKNMFDSDISVESLIPFSHNFTVYYLFLFFKLYLFCILISNIALFFIKKIKNFVLIMISTFMSYLIMCFISEIIISDIILNKVFSINVGYSFNIMDLLNNANFKELSISVIFILLLMIISIIINCINYRSKENVIISREKI